MRAVFVTHDIEDPSAHELLKAFRTEASQALPCAVLRSTQGTLARDLEQTCERLAYRVPEATHVVLREVLHGDWARPGYIMLHGTSRQKVEETADRVAAEAGIFDQELIFSLQNLKP